MNVDREQQKTILQILFDEYPWSKPETRQTILRMIEESPERTIGNLLYLQKHGLIENAVEITRPMTFENGIENAKRQLMDFNEDTDGIIQFNRLQNEYLIGPAKFYIPEITEKGIDFLLGDDGLSSILNIKRVRIEESSLKLLSSTLLELAAASSEDQKESILDQIKQAPIDGLKDFIAEKTKEELSSLELAQKIGKFLIGSAIGLLAG